MVSRNLDRWPRRCGIVHRNVRQIGQANLGQLNRGQAVSRHVDAKVDQRRAAGGDVNFNREHVGPVNDRTNQLRGA